jgi:predicted secreted protein
MKFLMPLLLAVLTFAPLSAQAQDFEKLLSLPSQAAMMTISAQDRAYVEQDLLTARMSVQAEDQDAKVLQQKINTLMSEALETTKAVESVESSTYGYHVYEHDPNRYKKGLLPDPIWKGQQNLQLKSKDSAALLELVGTLQTLGLTVDNLQYSISPELQEETQNTLMDSALKKLLAKADKATKALGRSDFRLLKIDMGEGHMPGPMPMMRAMAMDSMEKSSAPVAAPAQSEVTLSVSASILVVK